MKNINLPAINIHLTKACNAKCKFCFAGFENSTAKGLGLKSWISILTQLAEAGCQKVNFAGGEPTLRADLKFMIDYAKSLGMTTSVISNGFNIEQLILDCHESLDWIGLSLDSINDNVLMELGRTRTAGLPNKIAELLTLAQSFGIKTKLNTVVTSQNYQEDMADYVKSVGVSRWKVFQVLPIKGENLEEAQDLFINDQKFNEFLDNNKLPDILVPESNDAMTDSYAMINPDGCFFSNSDGVASTSLPILKYGVLESLRGSGYKYEKLISRGGEYSWENKSTLEVI